MNKKALKEQALSDVDTYEVLNAQGQAYVGSLRDCAKFLHVRAYCLGSFVKHGKHYNPRLKGCSAKKHVPVVVKEEPEVASKRKLMRFEKNGLYINGHANYVVCISANHVNHEYKFVAIYKKTGGNFQIAPIGELSVSVTDENGVTKKKRGVTPRKRIYPIDINGLDQAGLVQLLELRDWYAKTKGLEVEPLKVNVVFAQTNTPVKTTVVSTVKEAGPLDRAVVDDRLANLETLVESMLKERKA